MWTISVCRAHPWTCFKTSVLHIVGLPSHKFLFLICFCAVLGCVFILISFFCLLKVECASHFNCWYKFSFIFCNFLIRLTRRTESWIRFGERKCQNSPVLQNQTSNETSQLTKVIRLWKMFPVWRTMHFSTYFFYFSAKVPRFLCSSEFRFFRLTVLALKIFKTGYQDSSTEHPEGMDGDAVSLVTSEEETFELVCPH